MVSWATIPHAHPQGHPWFAYYFCIHNKHGSKLVVSWIPTDFYCFIQCLSLIAFQCFFLTMYIFSLLAVLFDSVIFLWFCCTGGIKRLHNFICLKFIFTRAVGFIEFIFPTWLLFLTNWIMVSIWRILCISSTLVIIWWTSCITSYFIIIVWPNFLCNTCFYFLWYVQLKFLISWLVAQLFQWVWISSKRMWVLFLIFNAIAREHGNPKVIKLKQPHLDLSIPISSARSASSAR